jgi:hypothetical protein
VTVSVVLFLIMVTSLAANISNLRNQIQNASSVTTQLSYSVTSTVTPRLLVIQPIYGSSSSDSVYWYFAILFSLLCSVIVYAYFKGKKRNWGSQSSIIAQVLASLVGLAFIILIFNALLSNREFFVMGFSVLLDYFLIGIIVLGGVLGLAILFREFDVFDTFRRKVSGNIGVSPSPVHSSDKDKSVGELKKAIESALCSLDNLGNYRLAILNCYKAVVSILERYGMIQKASLTSREFEREISSRLGITPSKYLHNLTLLFECARYGSEELTAQEAADAKHDLEKLVASLENPVILTTDVGTQEVS